MNERIEQIHEWFKCFGGDLQGAHRVGALIASSGRFSEVPLRSAARYFPDHRVSFREIADR
jgi:hypothetical protein